MHANLIEEFYKVVNSRIIYTQNVVIEKGKRMKGKS